jgi:hypothetical protein
VRQQAPDQVNFVSRHDNAGGHLLGVSTDVQMEIDWLFDIHFCVYSERIGLWHRQARLNCRLGHVEKRDGK